MALVDQEKKEISCKILYFGAEGAGKASNLCALLQQTSDAGAGSELLVEPLSPAPVFHFLPLSVGTINSYLLKAHLYTCPAELRAYPL